MTERQSLVISLRKECKSMNLIADEVDKEPKKGDVYIDNKGVAEICVGKNRGGPTGTVTCEYVKQFTLFRSSGRR